MELVRKTDSREKPCSVGVQIVLLTDMVSLKVSEPLACITNRLTHFVDYRFHILIYLPLTLLMYLAQKIGSPCSVLSACLRNPLRADRLEKSDTSRLVGWVISVEITAPW